MADITLAAFLADVGTITAVLMTSIQSFLQLCMTPPLNIFVAAAVLAVGIRYGMRILKGTKNVA
jgi:hypothetical protein